MIVCPLNCSEGWLWSPDHDLLKRVKFPRIKSLDTSKTPKAGEQSVATPVLAKADISRLMAQLVQLESGGTLPAPKSKRAAPPTTTPAKGKKAAPAVSVASPDEIGAALIAARQVAGLSQKAVAAKMSTQQQNIARLENGKSKPSLRTLENYAAATGHRLAISLTPDG